MSPKEETDNSQTASIPPLDDSNYPEWALRIKVYLLSKDLYDVVAEPSPAPRHLMT